MTKTDQGLALVAQGLSVRQAARKVDMSESALHTAVKRRRDDESRAAGICPCCNRPLDSTKLLTPKSQ